MADPVALIRDLLIGLPDQRPGGLALTILSAVAAATVALVLGTLYAGVCIAFPRLSLGLQALLAALRGTPLIVLLFFLVQASTVPLPAAGFAALLLYSLSHVGETLRAFLSTYPATLREQARLMGMGWVREWLGLRLPWTFRQALDALGTHWISLLKDTGALTMIGLGELTTVARVMSERAGVAEWEAVLLAAAALYLLASLTLMGLLEWIKQRVGLRRALA